MKLKPCPPKTKNCYLTTFTYEGGLPGAKARLRAAIDELEEVIWVREDEDHWHMECRTKLFRFVDDLEMAFPPTGNEIQVRSASRLGKYDFGVNRKRVETLRDLFARA